MTDQTPLAEKYLMQRIVARDQKALAEMYDLFGAMVYGMALRVLGSSALAEEVAQDTFLKVWNQAAEWDAGRGKIVTWLLTITRYTAIDHLRKELRRNADSTVDIETVFNVLSQSSLVEGDQWANAQVLKKLIAQLSAEQIQAIEMAFFKGMSHSEIAEQLQIPLGTIKSRIRQGLQTLKKLWLDSVE